MRSISIYKSPTSDALSRGFAKDWLKLVHDDMIEQDLAERVMLCKESDFVSLTHSLAKNMHYAIELECSGLRLHY